MFELPPIYEEQFGTMEYFRLKANHSHERMFVRDMSRSYVRIRVMHEGWTDGEWVCLDELIFRESSWDKDAKNPNSSAFGLFQTLKTDPDTPLKKQTERGIKYIKHRYDTPCEALAFHDRKGWY